MSRPRTRATLSLTAAAVVVGAGAAVAATASGPKHVTAKVMQARSDAARRGSVVAGSALFGNRVFPTASEGFALANRGQAQYPVRSDDGGRTWRIDGPQLHVDAADAPEAVSFVGASGAATLYAYGSSVVDVTTDGGKVWREAYLPGLVTAMAQGADGGLVAYADQPAGAGRTSSVQVARYVTRDGGRHWTLSSS